MILRKWGTSPHNITKLDIQNRARDLGISFIKKSRKKFGWSYKTFDEIKFEV